MTFRLPTPKRFGRRSAVLLALSALDIGVGLSYIWPTAETLATQGTEWRSAFAPLWAWGLMWVTAGCCCLAAVAMRNESLGFVAALPVKVMWSLLELTGWLTGEIDQGYRPGLIWAVFATIIYIVAGLVERPPTEPPLPDPVEKS